jgi:hypothetical protein
VIVLVASNGDVGGEVGVEVFRRMYKSKLWRRENETGGNGINKI